ncbi:hypothetical protein J437_LFUL005512 [Ladona fulva]|uniref:RING-type E3 ubiquitin transferase n=1 Tax=Ladona fulva TaxID=123851 RepID=A0A8K0K1P4_LADFU|nr:hypothetical protein J437_LFUL005512 [Ladona fulva]
MAEGGPGRFRNYRENRFSLRSRESSRPCKFYIQGNCSYGENCRFRHTDTNHRANQEDHPGFQAEQNEARIESKPNALRESKPKESTGESETDLKFASGACSISSVEDWVNAPEFFPSGMDSPKTYAEAVSSLSKSSKEVENEASNASYPQTDGAYGPFCVLCDICNEMPLDPNNEEERRKHVSECIKRHERDMELSFAIQRSKDKACGICFEVIMEKANGEQKFGILPNCNHSFCLSCIRKWRQAKHFDNKIIRACPECRVSSDFVCPSIYWVESKEDKEKLIVDYKEALSAKDCKYFLKGRGKCPFGNKCFYKHAYPDGTKADVGPPVRQRRQNADGEVAVFRQVSFLEKQSKEIMNFVIKFLSFLKLNSETGRKMNRLLQVKFNFQLDIEILKSKEKQLYKQ